MASCVPPPFSSFERKVPGPFSFLLRLCKPFLALRQAPGELRSRAVATEMVGIAAEESPASWKMERESSIQGKWVKGNPPSASQKTVILLYHRSWSGTRASRFLQEAFPDLFLRTPTIPTWSLNYLLPFTFIHLPSAFSLLQTVSSFRGKDCFLGEISVKAGRGR